MSVAFRTSVTSTQKLVLLALCDSANDSGECYPSVPKLVEKCSLSERAIQTAISDLERMGQLRRELRTGRSTVYWMTPNTDKPPQQVHPRTTCTPAAGAPTPARRAPPPPQQVHPTPARRAPITINEPSVEPSGNHQQTRAKKPKAEEVGIAQLLDAGFDLKTAQEFIDHKRGRKAPLTARAWADHLRESTAAGWAPMAAAEKVMARNWSGFEARYVAGHSAPASAAQSFAEKNAEAKRLLGIKPSNQEFIDA